jgi:hypothetical protein
MRLYDTTFDRTHDQGSLKAWTGGLDSGMTMKQIANGFMASREFQSKCGSLDDAAIVKNVLHREGEATGVQAWVGGLKHSMSRVGIVTGFSESAENVERTKATVDKGLRVTDENAVQVARLYDTTLACQLDAVDLEAWGSGLTGGMTLKRLADGFSEPAEHQVKLAGVIEDGIHVYHG